MSPQALDRPTADPSSWVWNWDGALESVQDARKITRGQAANYYSVDTGEWFPAIRVWKRHARALSRLDQWIWYVENRTDGWDRPDATQLPPDDWKPDIWDGDMPAWEFCHADDEGAVPVWICAPRGTTPPPKVARNG